jgi:glycosyltransferase involved in cell wall biosynthesis
MPVRILFLVPYPIDTAPSQRFRFEQYFGILKSNGYEYEVQSFISLQNWRRFYAPKGVLQKVGILIAGFFKRILILPRVFSFDFIFIHREATPVGPPVFEWIIAKVFRKKIIYDFDDAIWISDGRAESLLLQSIKFRGKVRSICRWAYKVSCGNAYLCDFARQYNNNVVRNPTTIDTTLKHDPDLLRSSVGRPNHLVIGWTGSHSTLKYLKVIEHCLQLIQRQFQDVTFVVIADRKPDIDLKFEFIPWNEDSEIADLLRFDIGIMPLPDDEWSKGKCGFKALQYMALKIPAVASAVGVNTHIIETDRNGILCTTEDDWLEALTVLIRNPALRLKLGEQGRKKVIGAYSVLSNKENFSGLFR